VVELTGRLPALMLAGTCLAAPAYASGAGGAGVADLADAPPILESIVVTATKAQALDVGGSVHLLDQQDLDRFSYGDVHRALRQVPGVYIQEEEGFGLRPNIGIRGSGTDRSNRIAVMEDGVLIAPAPYAAPAAYYFPRLTRISAVEISKGPAAIKYGPLTVGGAVNFFSTPIPDVPAGSAAGRVELLAGNHGGRRAHGWTGGWVPLGGRFELGGLVEGLYEASDGFKRIDAGGDTGFAITDLVGKIGIRSTDGVHALEFKYQRYDERSDETYLGLTLSDFRADPFRRYNASHLDQMNVDHETWQLSHRFELSPRVTLTTIAYRHDTARAWYKLHDVRNAANSGWAALSAILRDPAAHPLEMADLIGEPGFVGRPGALRVRDNNRVYRSTGIQSVLTTRFSTGRAMHNLELSARYHEDDEDRFQQDDRYQMVDGRMQLTSAGAPGSQDNRLGAATAWAFYVRDRIEAGPLTLVPGLRFETIDLRQTRWGTDDPNRTGPTIVSDSRVNVLIPGISATWRVSPDVRLIAGVHRGFAHPAPGSNIDPETSWNYEAGVRLGEERWRAELIGYFNDYSNLVGTCTASTGGGCTIGDQFSGGEVDVKGIEALASYSFGGAGYTVPVTLAYTYTDARFQTSFTSRYGPWGTVTAGDRLPYVPEHQLTAGIGLELNRARFSSAFNWTSKARARAGQGAIPAQDLVDDRLLVDVSAEIDVGRGLALFGTVQNLFDVTYNVAFSPAGARPGGPRLALGGLRAKF
jgi:Fe(3+) dicitrate transport protein